MGKILAKYEALKYIEGLNENVIVEITKKSKKSIRSLQQIRYYWGCVVAIIGDFHGLTPIETNESLKLLFKKETFTDLSTEEFSFAINTIREVWKTKYEVTIPSPEDKNLYDYIDNN